MREEEERQVALEAMRKRIEERMALPMARWVAFEEDDLFEQARQRLSGR